MNNKWFRVEATYRMFIEAKDEIEAESIAEQRFFAMDINGEYRNMTVMVGAHIGTSYCAHCGRDVSFDNGMWVDDQATGDDSVWREVCDSNDSFPAVHEVMDEGVTA